MGAWRFTLILNFRDLETPEDDQSRTERNPCTRVPFRRLSYIGCAECSRYTTPSPFGEGSHGIALLRRKGLRPFRAAIFRLCVLL